MCALALPDVTPGTGLDRDCEDLFGGFSDPIFAAFVGQVASLDADLGDVGFFGTAQLAFDKQLAHMW